MKNQKRGQTKYTNRERQSPRLKFSSKKLGGEYLKNSLFSIYFVLKKFIFQNSKKKKINSVIKNLFNFSKIDIGS